MSAAESSLPDVLKWNTTLRSLTIECDNMYDKTGVALAEAPTHNVGLLVLTLDGGYFSNVSGEAIADALKLNATLQHLTLLLLGVGRIV